MNDFIRPDLLARIQPFKRETTHKATSDAISQYKDKLFNELTLIKSTEGIPYAILERDGIKQLYEINSSNFYNALSSYYTELNTDFIEPSELKRIISGATAYALNSDEQQTVAARLMKAGGKLIYNLDNNNTVIVISEKGIETVDNSELKYLFVHANDMKSQALPDLSAKPFNLIPMLKQLLKLSEDDYLLLAVYICSLFIPDIHHPIFTAYGDYGSGKSTALRTIGEIVDPSSRGLLFLNRKSQKDLIISLTRSYFTAFDNTSGRITEDIVNLFCQVVTGGTVSMRQLYKDTDEVVLKLKRCLALNGTDIVGKRNDLMERSLLMKFTRLETDTLISDSDYNSLLSNLMPKILGSIFSILSRAMKLHSEKQYVLPIKHRMLEWMEWGYCIAESIRKGYGTRFCNDYTANLTKSNAVAVDDNPYIACIEAYVKENGSYIGSSTEFYENIFAYAVENGFDTRSKMFPSCATQVWQKMKTYSVNLAKSGIIIHEPVNKGKFREIKIIKN